MDKMILKPRVLQSTKTSTHDRCDVCIIGAGAAGCYLAARLASQGLDVVLLEAGGATGIDPMTMGFVPQFLNEYYAGAIEGRAMGLGGTTSRWGGLLAPHSQHDLRAARDESTSSTWQHIVEVVSAQSENVLGRLGYHKQADFDTFPKTQLNGEIDALQRAGMEISAGLFLPFRRKNLLHLLGGASESGPGVRVYTDAVAKDWQFTNTGRPAGTISNLTAVSANGASLNIRASRFVVTAGTIESARILLELKTLAPNGYQLSDDVGKFLGDHLSVGIADVAAECLHNVSQSFAPRFQGHWMRSFRFIESNPPANSPRAFAHFVFENEQAGFQLAKKVMSGIQARRIPKLNFTEALCGVRGVVDLAVGRYLHSRLHIPKRTTARLQLDIEQHRNSDNQVVLGNELDAYGRRVVQIDWRITEADVHDICSAADRIVMQWNSNSGDLPRLIQREINCDSQKPHDAYHPVGTCRMGADAGSVVDFGLKVRGVKNLWLASTGVLPSAGTANPTFSLLCLTEQLAQEFVRSQKQELASSTALYNQSESPLTGHVGSSVEML